MDQLPLEFEPLSRQAAPQPVDTDFWWNGYAIDFGGTGALAIHGPDGSISVPKLSFVNALELLLNGDDLRGLPAGHVVCESATVGSCGVEASIIKPIVYGAPKNMYLIATRATKNYKKDNGLFWDKETKDLTKESHAGDAKIIYHIAASQPHRLKIWKPSTLEDRLERKHTSVRPHDKRDYQGDEPDRWMTLLPPFTMMPPHLRVFLGNKNSKDYARAKAMPLAMAFEEDGAETRSGYERILGLYEHGYPSFYRRTTVNLMQTAAKNLADTTRIQEVSREIRKEAWKVVRRNIRQIYHLSVEWQTSYRARAIPRRARDIP